MPTTARRARLGRSDRVDQNGWPSGSSGSAASNELDYAPLAANAELPRPPAARSTSAAGSGAGSTSSPRTAGRPPGSSRGSRRPRLGRGTRCSRISRLTLVRPRRRSAHARAPARPARDAAQARRGHGPGRPDLRLGPEPSSAARARRLRLHRERQAHLLLHHARSARYSPWPGASSWPTRTRPRGGSGRAPQRVKRLAAIARRARGEVPLPPAPLDRRSRHSRLRVGAAGASAPACALDPRGACSGAIGAWETSALRRRGGARSTRNRAKARSRGVSTSNERSAGIS